MEKNFAGAKICHIFYGDENPYIQQMNSNDQSKARDGSLRGSWYVYNHKP